MQRVVPPKIKFIYAGMPDSGHRLETAYARIFALARQNILLRKQSEGKKKAKKRLKNRVKSSVLTTKRHQGNVCVA
jgi:hypothetical protein